MKQKLDEMITCPHCKKNSSYVFYPNTDNLECHNCEKIFDIEVELRPVIIAKIPQRKCCICNAMFISNEYEQYDEICPSCDYKGGHYNLNNY